MTPDIKGADWKEMERRAREFERGWRDPPNPRVTVALALLALAITIACGVVIAMSSGCAHKPAVDTTTPVVLDERVGGPVADVFEEMSGLDRINGVTLPGLPPIIFAQNARPCTSAHELRHAEQQRRDGPIRWAARYTVGYLLCRLEHVTDDVRETAVKCYADSPYEVDARDAERECERNGAQ